MAVHKKYNNGTKSNALGRGLDALISTESVRTQGSSTINEIALDQIEANPNQPRREFDDEALHELAESIKAIGIIILGWGIVQVGLSFQSHDPSQRSNGFLTLAGGIIITFAKEILTLITG